MVARSRNVAKSGIKLCQAHAREYGAKFISVMPTNLYGPNDNFDLETSHVLAALLRKAAARTIDALIVEIAVALTKVSPHECANYLASQGYLCQT